MKLEDQVCSESQGRRLEEFGISAMPIFCHCWVSVGPEDSVKEILPTDKRLLTIPDTATTWLAPAFTVAELGVMLPEGSEFGGDWYMRYCWKGVSFGYNRKNAGLQHIEQDWYKPNEWAKALADLVIYLLEKNLTTSEEVNKRLAE